MNDITHLAIANLNLSLISLGSETESQGMACMSVCRCHGRITAIASPALYAEFAIVPAITCGLNSSKVAGDKSRKLWRKTKKTAANRAIKKSRAIKGNRVLGERKIAVVGVSPCRWHFCSLWQDTRGMMFVNVPFIWEWSPWPWHLDGAPSARFLWELCLSYHEFLKHVYTTRLYFYKNVVKIYVHNLPNFLECCLTPWNTKLACCIVSKVFFL